MSIYQFSHFQMIALKNLYDQEIWPNRIGFIQETLELIIEYQHTMIGPNGPFTKAETVLIPYQGPEIKSLWP